MMKVSTRNQPLKRALFLLILISALAGFLTSASASSNDDERRFDEHGRLQERADHLGNRTAYLRDSAGRLVKTVHLLNKAGSWSERYLYDDDNNRVVAIVNMERSLAGRVLGSLAGLGVHPGRDLPAESITRDGSTVISENALGRVEETVPTEETLNANGELLLRRQKTRVAGHEVTVEALRTDQGRLLRDDLGGWRLERYDDEGLSWMGDQWGDLVRVQRDRLGRPLKVELGGTAALEFSYADGSPDWVSKSLLDLGSGELVYRYESILRPGSQVVSEQEVRVQPQAAARVYVPSYGPVAEWDETLHPGGVLLAGIAGTPFTLLPLDEDNRVLWSATLTEPSISHGWDRIDYDDSMIYLRLTTDSNAIDGGDRSLFFAIPRTRTSTVAESVEVQLLTKSAEESTGSQQRRSDHNDDNIAMITGAMIKRWCQGIANFGCICWDDGADSGVICPEQGGDDGGSGDGGGGGGGGTEPGGGGGAGAGSVPLSPEQSVKLNAAKSRADNRLSNLQACRDLFKDLALKDGAAVIEATTYRSYPNSSSCSSGAAMWTTVGSLTVYLCSSFVNQTASMQAALVIHEAMHSAGQKESPQYPGYPTSTELTNLVRSKCNL